MPRSLPGRVRQAWTIAKIELRRVFFARRSLWVYALALLPSVIFFGHGLEAKFRMERLAGRDVIAPALMDSVRDKETADEVKKRLGKPAEERWSTRSQRVRQHTGNAGTTTHVIEPAADARFVRLNVIRPTYSGEPVARIFEFEVYGPDATRELRQGVPGSPEERGQGVPGDPEERRPGVPGDPEERRPGVPGDGANLALDRPVTGSLPCAE